MAMAFDELMGFEAFDQAMPLPRPSGVCICPSARAPPGGGGKWGPWDFFVPPWGLQGLPGLGYDRVFIHKG